MLMSLWDLIQRYVDETGATEAAIMRRANLNKGTFTAWRARGVPSLPSRGNMLDLAEALKVDYETVLNAVLYETAYLPEARARHEQRRLDAIIEELNDRSAEQMRKYVADLLSDSEGQVARARDLNHELRVDGSVDPDMAGHADEILAEMDAPKLRPVEALEVDEAAYDPEPEK